MPLVPYRGRDPFRALENLRSEINRLFEGSLDLFPRFRESFANPSTDIWEDEKHVYVEAELPGFDRKEIDVTLHDDRLTISAQKEDVKEEKEKNYYRSERYRGRYHREISLPSTVNSSAEPKAEFKNGVLNIAMEKKEEAKGREIKVKVD